MNTQPCNCEHASHPMQDAVFGTQHPDFPDYLMDHHYYGEVPAGNREARWVGPICDDCANTHMSKYLV